EGLTEDAGVVHVGIERANQIVRFDIGKDGLRARGRPIAVPPGLKRLPYNKSIECLEVAPKNGPLSGALVAISAPGRHSNVNLNFFLICIPYIYVTKVLFSLNLTYYFD